MDPSSFDNGRDFCVRFQRTTTNAEVAVGNRNALEMRGTRDCVWIEERGPLKLEIQIIVDGGGEEIRDRVICDSLVENGFLTLQNRRRKAVGGGGSDAGAWISLQIGEPLSLRKEIRCVCMTRGERHFRYLTLSLSLSVCMCVRRYMM